MNTETCFIAFVDDHVLLRNGLSNLVDQFEGYKVLFEADNGEDFIRQLKPPHYPDIVLLDITMPVMNGYQTAEWIRANLPNTKVLVLTMLDNDNAVIRMLKSGARGYLLKDSKPTMVKEALDQLRNDGFYFNNLIKNKVFQYLSRNPGPESSEKDQFVHLTEREITYLTLACSERTHREIAEEMNVSIRTVDSYRDAIYEKTGVSSRVGLVLFAIRCGYFDANSRIA